MQQATTPFVNPDPVLSPEQAAAFCGRKPVTLKKWRVRGRGPAFLRFGREGRGGIGYRLSDLQNFIEKCRVVPGEKRTRRRVRKAA